jgi:serine/threonine-protein kinase
VGPKLTDFGIARLPDSTLTRASTVLGTPAYSAPEALASGAFGAYSDQFSLAATLYEALTGKRAFPGDDALAVATRVATGKQPAPTAVLPTLRGFQHVDVILDRALAKEAKKRFASCEAFGSALAAELEGANAAHMMTPIPRSSIVTRATRRWQNVAALAALVVIVALIIVGRFREPEEDGVSLKSVASAFAATAVMPRLPGTAATGAASHHSRIAAGASAAASAGSASSASSAASAPPPATTPSGSAHPALDSAPADAGREHIPIDVRIADAGPPPDATQR